MASLCATVPAVRPAGYRKVSACAWFTCHLSFEFRPFCASYLRFNKAFIILFNYSSHAFDLRGTVPYSLPEYRLLPFQQLQLVRGIAS